MNERISSETSDGFLAANKLTQSLAAEHAATVAETEPEHQYQQLADNNRNQV